MVLGTRYVFLVEAPHGKKRGQSQGGGDENIEELGVAIQGDHAPKLGPRAPRQDPARGYGSGQRSKDGSDYRHGRSLDPAGRENERQSLADQNQLRD